MRVASDSSCPCSDGTPSSTFYSAFDRELWSISRFCISSHFFLCCLCCLCRFACLTTCLGMHLSPRPSGMVARQSRKIEAHAQLTSHTSASRRAHHPPNPEFEAVTGLPSVPASCCPAARCRRQSSSVAVLATFQFLSQIAAMAMQSRICCVPLACLIFFSVFIPLFSTYNVRLQGRWDRGTAWQRAMGATDGR